jgi:hypothetical protein
MNLNRCAAVADGSLVIVPDRAAKKEVLRISDGGRARFILFPINTLSMSY